jgi:beta-lactamase regulating signal transducer with metallopeptidase domain
MESLQPHFLVMAHSLGWALVHSLWQSLFIYTLVQLILKIVARPSARMAYNLSFIALCGMFVWFLHTWVTNWHMLASTVANNDTALTAQYFVAANNVVLDKTITYQLQQALPVVALLYLAGVLLLATRVVYNYRKLTSYKTQGVVPATDHSVDMLNNLKQLLNTKSSVKLQFSEYVSVPMVIGVIKPLILVPLATATQLNTQQLETILVHELAHIKRNDYFFNILQAFIGTVLFFNPFAWAMSRTIRREREHCCDDMVLEHTGAPLSYAHALAALETTRQSQLALAAIGNKKLLFNRIKRIMEMKKTTINSPLAVVLLVAGLAVSLVCLTPIFAQTKKTTTKAPKTTTKEKITITDNNGKTRTYNSMKDVPAKDRAAMVTPPVPPDPVIPVHGMTPIPPVAPIAPIAPIAPMAVSGIPDSTMALAMEAANKAIASANMSIADANKALAAVDWKQINADVEKAMKEVDWKEINADIEKAMKEVDWKEINADIEKAMKEVDWKEINAEVAKAQKEAEKARKEAQKQIKEREKKRKTSDENSW